MTTATPLLILGSLSPHKVLALHGACANLGLASEIHCVETKSAVDLQPQGEAAIRTGAEHRAAVARRAQPNAYGIGIENGIMSFAGLDLRFDLACIVVHAPDDRLYYALSPAIRFPTSAVMEAYWRGFKNTTAGQVIVERQAPATGDHQDPHAILMFDRMNRVDLLTAGLMVALAQVPEFNPQ